MRLNLFSRKKTKPTEPLGASVTVGTTTAEKKSEIKNLSSMPEKAPEKKMEVKKLADSENTFNMGYYSDGIYTDKFTSIDLSEKRHLSFKCQEQTQASKGGVNCLAVLPDGEIVVGTTVIEVWDPVALKCLQILDHPSKEVSPGKTVFVVQVLPLPSGLLATRRTEILGVDIWDLKLGKWLANLKSKKAPGVNIISLLLMPNNNLLVASAKQIDIWDITDVKKSKLLKTFANNGSIGQSIGLLSSGRLVETRSGNAFVGYPTKSGYRQEVATAGISVTDMDSLKSQFVEFQGQRGDIFSAKQSTSPNRIHALAVLGSKIALLSSSRCSMVGNYYGGPFIILSDVPPADKTERIIYVRENDWDLPSVSMTTLISPFSESNHPDIDSLVALSDESLASIGKDDKGVIIEIWDVKRKLCTAVLRNDYGKDEKRGSDIQFLAPLPGEKLVSGSGFGGIRIWTPSLNFLPFYVIQPLLTQLKNNRTVVSLNLQYTLLNDDSVTFLIDLLRANTTLTTLNIQNTAITLDGIKRLLEAVQDRKPTITIYNEHIAKIAAEKEEILSKEKKLQEEKQKYLQELHQSADKGSTAAQWDLGNRYEKGHEVVEDMQRAFELYQKAASQGHVESQQKLGEIFEKGLAGKKDYAQAYSWYQKAADQGNDAACAGLKSLKDKGYSPPPSADFKATSTSDKSPVGPSSPITKEAKDDMSSAVSFEINYDQLTLGKELGRGGFGVVYQGTWRFNNIAIKQLLTKSLSAEALEEFNSESRIMAQLRSEYIVQFYGRCITPTYCLVMQYMPKGSLFNLLRSSEPLDWSVRHRMIMEIASGLAFLHASNIFHRDLKSLNVLLDEHYRTKLCDFGLSKVKKENQSTATLGGPVGTIPWMAPELFERRVIFTAKSDIYSLAMTLWEIASRKTPFADASNPGLISVWVAQGQREEIPSDTPLKISSLIRCCWHQDPTKRPTAAEVVTYLRSDQAEFKLTETALSSPVTTSIQGNLASSAGVGLDSSSIRANLMSGSKG